MLFESQTGGDEQRPPGSLDRSRAGLQQTIQSGIGAWTMFVFHKVTSFEGTASWSS